MTDSTSQQSTNQGNDRAEREYDYAISLMQYHTDLLWKEFSAFLLANTVLIGFLATALADKEPIVRENWLVFLGSILGLLICPLWCATFQHNYKYYQLRVLQAKRHESALGISLLSEGGMLSEGEPVHIGDEKLQFHPLAQHLPPRRSVPLLIGLYAIAFGILIVISGPWM